MFRSATDRRRSPRGDPTPVPLSEQAVESIVDGALFTSAINATAE